MLRASIALFAASLLIAGADSAWATPAGPEVRIVSPVDGQAVAGGLLQVVVEYSAKLNAKGQYSGNVTRIELKANGAVIAVHDNPPNIKFGSFTFVVDLSQFGPGPIVFSAVAYQGNGSSAPSGTSASATVELDVAPPVISGPHPADGALGISGSVEIRADLFDAGSGIEPAASRMTLDAADVTSSATRTASRISYMAAGLLDGAHTVSVDAADRAGNPAHLEWTFRLDLTDPVASFTQPAEDMTVGTSRPMFTLTYADPTANGYHSGIDPATGVELFEDGANVTAEAVRGADSATYTPPADRPLSEGAHHYVAVVHDRAGRSTMATRTVTVVTIPPTVTIVLPAADSVTADPGPDFKFTYFGPNGAVPAFAKINGRDVLDRFTIGASEAVYHPKTGDPVFLVAGDNLFEVGVADASGLMGTALIHFSLVLPGGGSPPTVVPANLVLEIKDGDGQEGPIGRCLEGPPAGASHEATEGKPPTVRAYDGRDSSDVPGLPLLFASSDPTGFFVPAPGFATVTDGSGRAAVRYINGRTEGPQTLTVSILGMPGGPSVTFHETAVKPIFTVTFPLNTHAEVLVGSGEAFAIASLTRPLTTGGVVNVHANVQVDMLDDAGTPLVDPPGIYVNPRSRPTDSNGFATFDIIPDEARLWMARVSVPEFPELLPVVKPFLAAVSASRPGPVRSMLSSTPLGQITTHDHEIAIHADLSPMRSPGANPAKETFTVKLTSPVDTLGHPIYEFAEVDKLSWVPGELISRLTGIAVFGFWVRPVADTPGPRPFPISAFMTYTLLGPDPHDPTRETVLGAEGRNEFLGIGSPEVRFVQRDLADSSKFVERNFIVPFDPTISDAPASPSNNFLEARLPVDEAEPSSADLFSLDECRLRAHAVEGALAPNSIAGLSLSRVNTTTRFALFRTLDSRPIVAMTVRLALSESAPDLPSTVDLIQVPTGGHLSGTAFAEDEIPVKVDPAYSVTYQFVPEFPTSAYYRHPRVQPIPSLAVARGGAVVLHRRITPPGAFEDVAFENHRSPFSPDLLEVTDNFAIPTADEELIGLRAVVSAGMEGVSVPNIGRFQTLFGRQLRIPYQRDLDYGVFPPLPRRIRIHMWRVVDGASPAHGPALDPSRVEALTKEFWTHTNETIWGSYNLQFEPKGPADLLPFDGDLGDDVDASQVAGAHDELEDIWNAGRLVDGKFTLYRDDTVDLNLYFVHSLREQPSHILLGGAAPTAYPAYFIVADVGITDQRLGNVNAHELGHKLGISEVDYTDSDRHDELMSHGAPPIRLKITRRQGLEARDGATEIAAH